MIYDPFFNACVRPILAAQHGKTLGWALLAQHGTMSLTQGRSRDQWRCRLHGIGALVQYVNSK